MDRFETFTLLISSISRSRRRIKTEAMRKFNLKSPHITCLYYLYRGEKLTSKELTDLCEEDKAAISRSLDYLELNQYIYCESQAKKRYKDYLHLTEKGIEVGKYIADTIENILDISSKGVNEEEREIMYKCLNLICINLKNVLEKGE